VLKKFNLAHMLNINRLAKEGKLIMDGAIMKYYQWSSRRETIFLNKKKAAPIMELL